MTEHYDSESFDIDDLASLPDPERMIFDIDAPPPEISADLFETRDTEEVRDIEDLGVSSKKMSLRMRLRLWEKRFIEKADKKPKDKAAKEEETSSLPGGVAEERFAKLMRPLAPSELKRLETDVQKAELFFDTVDRVRRSNERIRSISLVISLAVIVLFLWHSGKEYLLGMADPYVPGWLNAPGLSEWHQMMIVQIAGFFLPILLAFLMTETITNFIRMIRHRVLRAAIPGTIMAISSAATWMMVFRFDFLMAFFVGVIGAVAGLFIADIIRPRGRGRMRR